MKFRENTLRREEKIEGKADCRVPRMNEQEKNKKLEKGIGAKRKNGNNKTKGANV